MSEKIILAHKNLVTAAKDPNSYYALGQKLSMAQPTCPKDQETSDIWSAIRDKLHSNETFPDDYVAPGPLYIGSPKPRVYDMVGDYLISERMVEVVRQHGGPEVKIWPINQADDPNAKYKVGMKFFLWQLPVISCLHYEYGDEIPTDPLWRKTIFHAQEGTKDKYPDRVWPEIPMTGKPLLKIWMDLEKVRNYQLFIPKEHPRTIFASKYFIEACKVAKLWGVNYDYSANEELEGIRSATNSYNGLYKLRYDKRSI